ncbi:MAG: 3'-5' exonuclease [Muribaculaceae bacterium]|nr:3'-5' exonuclease [Muribaculaceae bacterium]
MKLNLKRPIVFFDLETTGVNITHDRIVEISIIKVSPGHEDRPEIKCRRVNPEMHIPEEATAIHHITDEDVANEPTFRQIARSLADFMRGCDIAGFNSNRFDVPLLDEEFQRAGVDFDFHKARFVDVQTIFHKLEPRNLTAAYRFYCGKELVGAHGAQADTMATYEVLLAQLERYSELPNDVAQLAKFSSQNDNVDLIGRLVYGPDGRETINFGKYKGQAASDVLSKDPGYYSWIMQGDFPSDTKRAFTRIKLSLQNK